MLSGGPAAWLRSGELRRFVRFIIVGGLNSLVGYAIFAALILLGLPTPAAIVIGTVLAVLFNFLSTGMFVFRNRAGNILPRFVAVYAVQMALSIAAMSRLESMGLHPLVAALLLMPLLAVFTYFAMRRFVYR